VKRSRSLRRPLFATPCREVWTYRHRVAQNLVGFHFRFDVVIDSCEPFAFVNVIAYVTRALDAFRA
jgi:hypothetical protein